MNTIDPNQTAKYTHSPFPFGLLATSLVLLGGFFLGFVLIANSPFEKFTPVLIAGFFVGFLGGSVLYNYARSPFELDRRLLKAVTGGGRLGLYNGSWPFTRLLVYEDGIEVRFLFHCYFLPYDKFQTEPPRQGLMGFLTGGAFTIKNALPGVPSPIQFSAAFSGGSEKLLAEIRSLQENFRPRA